MIDVFCSTTAMSWQHQWAGNFIGIAGALFFTWLFVEAAWPTRSSDTEDDDG